MPDDPRDPQAPQTPPAEEPDLTDGLTDPEPPVPETPQPPEPPEAADPPADPQAPETPQAPEGSEPAGGHDFHKGLQQLQQRFAALERLLSERAAPPTDPAKAPEADELEQLAQAGADQVDPYGALPKLAARVKAQEQALNERLAQIEASANRWTAHVQALEAQRHRESFAAEHPALADQYDQIVATARQAAAPYAGQVAGEAWDQLAGMIWANTVEQFARSAAQRDAPANPHPPKPTKGAQVQPQPGAGRNAPANPEQEVDRLIDGLITGD